MTMKGRTRRQDRAAERERQKPYYISDYDRSLVLTATGQVSCRKHKCPAKVSRWGFYYCPECKAEGKRCKTSPMSNAGS